MQQITAELHRHEFQICGDQQLVKGFVYQNPKYRDGEHIRSKSAVTKFEGDLVFTETEIFKIIS